MKKYDEDYKREAVKKIHDGQSVASVSRELGVSEGVLHKWRKQAVAVATDGEREVIELKRRLREVEMERDILKKGADAADAGICPIYLPNTASLCFRACSTASAQ